MLRAAVRGKIHGLTYLNIRMTRPTSPDLLHKPLSDEDMARFAALLEDVSERTEQGLSLEHVDGFITALICGPRQILPAEYFPVLLGEGGWGIFDNAAQVAVFQSFFHRRWNQVVRALNAPIEKLTDPVALEPLIMDWEGLLEELPEDERAQLEAEGLPAFASVWAAGFLQVLDTWEADWELPVDSKDEAFVDEMLDPFFVLITPPEDLTPDEHNTRREEYVAMVIWSAYELRDFWRDRGCASMRAPVRPVTDLGRNALCPCGSGKIFKQCCGTEQQFH